MAELSIGRVRRGFCVYRTDPGTGKRRRFGLAACTREAAAAEAIDVYRREAQGPEGLLVSDLWEAYRKDLGDRPVGRNMVYIGKAILPHFGNLRPDQITRQHCRGYDAKRRHKGITQGSVHIELGYLRSTLKFAQKVNLVDRIPDIWRPAKPHTDKRILTQEEGAALIRGAAESHTRLALTLLLGTAGRIRAILGLTGDRVDFETWIIHLPLEDSVTRKGRARVPMNAMTRPALEAARPAALTDHVIEYRGQPVRSIRRSFTAAAKRSGIGHVRIHDLRHTAAVTMISAGAPMALVSQILGHSNLSVTVSTYARYQPDHMLEGVQHVDFSEPRKRTR